MTLESEKNRYDELNKLLEESGDKHDFEINVVDEYIRHFSALCMFLTLDELELIINDNLFEFDKNNLLDYKCIKVLDKQLTSYYQILQDLNRALGNGNISNYFQQFDNVWNQSIQAQKIKTILGLNREGIKLTPLGDELKSTIENLEKLFISFYDKDPAHFRIN